MTADRACCAETLRAAADELDGNVDKWLARYPGRATSKRAKDRAKTRGHKAFATKGVARWLRLRAADLEQGPTP